MRIRFESPPSENLAIQLIEITILVFLHIVAVVIWIGAHFFEALILHVSLKNAPLKTKLEFYSRVLFRFNKITGLAAASTLYFGILLATALYLGSLTYMFTTPWGLLSDLFLVALLIGLLAPLKPATVGNLFNIALSAAIAAGIAALASVAFSLELSGLAGTSWGIGVLGGAIIAIGLLVIGASQGIKRVQIGLLSLQVLAGGNGTEEPLKRLESLERKMLRMVIPENIVALAVIVLMVYAANPPF